MVLEAFDVVGLVGGIGFRRECGMSESLRCCLV
jgi:hypothetical protein